ncbi:MAG TPA: HisA/HisF-related TIM barrel protein [Gemmatimonadaceae bacterium]|nr:HisA/HisF-related TIM barrel protein [Gemmatimonadaceae bacterium]
MIVIPAIDIRGGICAQVTAARSRMARQTSDDPREVAAEWERHGFHRLQLMDFDGRAASRRSGELVRDILDQTASEVQVGGDISSGDEVQQLIDDGAAYVILGPRALREPEWLEGTVAAFPGRLIVAMRLHGRRIEARAAAAERDARAAIEDLSPLPLGGLLLAADFGTSGLGGEELDLLEDAVDAAPCPVLVAGGLRRLRELRALQDRGVGAAVVGAPLYDGGLDPRLVAEEFTE